MMLVRPLMTNLKMTVRDDCAVSACCPSPTLLVNAFTPYLSWWAVGLWTVVYHPPSQLLASEIRQTFLSTNPAYLLAFERRANGTPTYSFW